MEVALRIKSPLCRVRSTVEITGRQGKTELFKETAQGRKKKKPKKKQAAQEPMPISPPYLDAGRPKIVASV